MTAYTLFTRWPSVQRDSEMLCRRIAPELRLRLVRRQLAVQLARFERRAA